MKRPLFPKNKSINQERISFIERVVTRIAVRSRQTAISSIAPYPISNAVIGEDVRGVIMRYMFPCEGVITKGLIRLGSRPSSGVEATVKISNSISTDTRSFIITRRDMLVNPGLKVDSGDRLELFLKPLNGSIVKEVWVSFLWVPTVADVLQKSFLLDDILEDFDNFVDEVHPLEIKEGEPS